MDSPRQMAGLCWQRGWGYKGKAGLWYRDQAGSSRSQMLSSRCVGKRERDGELKRHAYR